MTSSIVKKLAYLLDLNPNLRPRRIVTRSGVRVRGIFPSRRFDCEMHWESGIERELINRLEASWRIVDAATQPITMPIPSLQRTGTSFDYTPDLALIDGHGRLRCGECKPQCYADEPDIQAKHFAIKLRLAQVSIGFFVTTENDLACEVGRLNSRDLVRGIRSPITASAKATLNRQISEIQPATFGELVDLVGHNCAFVALAHGMSYFDTHQRLSGSTALQPFQEHFDAANFIYRKSTD